MRDDRKVLMKFKAVIADVDGTLIAPNANPTTRASDNLVRTVFQARKLGVEFSLCTARSLDWVDGLVKSLKITAPIILDNGARIYHCGAQKYIFESFISDPAVPKVIPEMHKFHKEVFVVDKNGRHTVREGERKKFSHVIKMMILHVPPVQADKIFRSLIKLQGIAVTKSVSGADPVKESIHVTSKLSTKPNALKFIAKFMGWRLEEIIGVGDSYNDLEFLELCGLKVAMGNATSDIKKIADYVAPTYEDEGVARAIEKFIINN